MKYTRYFAFVIALLVATSCIVDDIDQPAINTETSCDEIKLFARITRFDDCEVDTRANKTFDEAYVSSMALAVFPINGGAIGDCISYIHLTGNNLTFTLDRKDIDPQYNDKPFALYIFANMPELPATMGELEDKSLDYFLNLAYENDGIRRPQTGFPMVGSLGDTITEGADGISFVLMPTRKDANGNTITDSEDKAVIGLPTVDNTPKDYIPIPMKALYAKMSFIISVEPDQYMQDGVAPMFTLNGYTVNNIPQQVHINEGLNSESPVSDNNVSVTMSNSAVQGSPVKFDFYIPERLLTPATTADNYDYPFKGNPGDFTRQEDKDQNGFRDEDEKYRQRFKPNLLGEDQAATYVQISGKYRDHQDNSWDVTYDLYLGEDSWSDFNIKRNTNYVNNVVIRGLTAYDDAASDGDGVFIDHRVNVSRSLPIIINLQRETKLDSHFEVRPLRVRYPLAEGENLPAGATVKVEILNVDGNGIPSWVRMEHNNGGTQNNTYCASGKRLYFTTDLVSNTLKDNGSAGSHPKGSTIELPLTGSNQETFWIYVDQCDEGAPLSDPNQMRKAMVRVTYSDNNGTKEPIDYILAQYKLYPVKTVRTAADVAGTNMTAGEYIYYIEHEEEYLHNYDSEDDYNNTEDKGMEWGLDGVQLSNTEDAFVISHITGEDNNIYDNIGDFTARQNQAFETLSPKPKYDFYLYRDIISIMGEYYKPNLLVDGYYADKLKVNGFAGYTLNDRIENYLLANKPQTDGADTQIKNIRLDQKPKSAFAYCYNRNKRDSNGNVTTMDWYLPSIDEIEDIMEFAYGDFDTEFQGNMYWSCQPAYIFTSAELQRYNRPWGIFGSWEKVNGNIYYGSYFSDDVERARATKAERENGVFKEAPSSGADESQKRTGNIYISLAGSKNTEWNNPTTTNTNPYHEGNLSRTGTKARVRCVRNPAGVTIPNENK